LVLTASNRKVGNFMNESVKRKPKYLLKARAEYDKAGAEYYKAEAEYHKALDKYKKSE